MFETDAFFSSVFEASFVDLLRFWLDFGRPREVEKLQKITKKRFRGAFEVRSDLRFDFGGDFKAILMDLGRILNLFWKDSASILKTI